MELSEEFVRQFKARDVELDSVNCLCDTEFIIENNGIIFSLEPVMCDKLLFINLFASKFVFKGNIFYVDDYAMYWEYTKTISTEEDIPLVVMELYTELEHCNILKDFIKITKIVQSLQDDLTIQQFRILKELVGRIDV